MVCDDQQPLREAVTLVVNALEQCEVVGYAADGPSCRDRVNATHPDLLILDVSIPGGGANVPRAVKHASPDTYVLIFTGLQDEQTHQEMLATGADRYSVKTGRLAPLISDPRRQDRCRRTTWP